LEKANLWGNSSTTFNLKGGDMFDLRGDRPRKKPYNILLLKF